MSSVYLQPASGGGLRFGFVSLPASAAETALEELEGLVVYELSGALPLQVKQSRRSLQPLQQWQAAKQAKAAAPAGGPSKAKLAGKPLEGLCEGGSVVPLVDARPLSKVKVSVWGILCSSCIRVRSGAAGHTCRRCISLGQTVCMRTQATVLERSGQRVTSAYFPSVGPWTAAAAGAWRQGRDAFM